MNKVVVTIVVLVVVALGFYLTNVLDNHEYRDYISPAGFQGNLAVAEEESKPILDLSKEKIFSLLSESKKYKGFSSLITWISIALASVVMVFSGLIGYKPGIDADSSSKNLDDMGKILNPRNFKMMLFLLALGNVCTLFTQKFDQIASEKNINAKELNIQLVETSQIIYDSTSTEVQVRIALRDLEFEVHSM